MAAGTAEHLLAGGNLRGSPGSTQLEFEVSRDYPLVTLVTMVAPSPDWFVGVSALALFENGDWVREKEVALVPWDAGTDSGVTFLSAGPAHAAAAAHRAHHDAAAGRGGRGRAAGAIHVPPHRLTTPPAFAQRAGRLPWLILRG